MRRAVSLLLLLLLTVGCVPSTPTTGVEPGDGPAASEEPTAVEGEGEPTGEPTPDEPAAVEPASFKEKVV